MTTTLGAALARLRNADPAAATPVGALETDPDALAMLARILGSVDDRSLAQPNRAPAVAYAGWRLPEPSPRQWR